MIRASSLSGDTLIACHFPVIPLPTWQLPVQALCSSAKRSSRLCSVGLTRAVSLPEQDTLKSEHPLGGSQRHLSSSYSRLNEDWVEEEGASDSSDKYDSTSSPEETSTRLRKEDAGAKCSLWAQNSFLPSREVDEDEEDEDSDGHNLHRYHEDSSFVLHGNSNWPEGGDDRNFTFPSGDMDSEWGNEGTMLAAESDATWLSHRSNNPDSLGTERRGMDASASGHMMLTCGERDPDGTEEKMPDCVDSRQRSSPELLSNTEYVSDSSCNSSDGVLVNFCTIYSKSNNPAVPHDLGSPDYPSFEGSVFLNLQPVPQTPRQDLQPDDMCVSSPLTPQGLDSNCNLYSLDPLPTGLSSLEISDLASRLQSQATLSVGTNQKYYKLVTCDLSSQSPSPLGSSFICCPEVHRTSSPAPPPESLQVNPKKGQENDINTYQEKRECDTAWTFSSDCQVSTSSTEKALSRRKQTDSFQNISPVPCFWCPSPHGCKCQGTSITPTLESETLEPQDLDAEKGACSLGNPVVRYSKAQRPTSLPIQPIVLIPTDKPQTKNLGCLLEQYMNQKSSKSGSSQPGFKFKVKSGQRSSDLQPTPMGGHCPLLPEAHSSSDSCSTCTPSPERFTRRHTWSQPSTSHQRPCASQSSLDPAHMCTKDRQDKTRPISVKTNPFSSTDRPASTPKPSLVKIPTYVDLIDLTPLQSQDEPRSQSPPQSHGPFHSMFSPTPPTLPPTTTTNTPNVLRPAADSGSFHGGLAAALSSVAPLSSLSSLLSFAGLHLQQTHDSESESLILSDRAPTDVCMSPDASYESMSISHLQRRGLLRSVSRAVDLIVAHFGSSRDPEDKMRLGNSSWSPTIAGLVLEHLCPTIQNILEDGLRDHKLDVIIGQRRNHSWSVVEVSTRIGPSTRVLHSLVSKIRQHPQLTSQSMRLRAFIMGLLNLRALELWFSHLHHQKDVVTSYYHSWGFLSMSLGRCKPLFQELLLSLQPLSVLPFDLNLLLEPRMLLNRQLCPEEQAASPPPPCTGLLVTSWPRLQGDRKSDRGDRARQASVRQESSGAMRANKAPFLAPIPEWWPKELDQVGDVVEAEEKSADTWSQISMDSRQEERKEEKDGGTPDMSRSVQGPRQGGLRWANLFGATDVCRTETVYRSHVGEQTKRRPSQWLQLDRSQLGLLAQSIRSMKPGGAHADADRR